MSYQQNSNRDFYVYAWLRSGGEPFYIGKGRSGRATELYRRNRLFKNIYNKLLDEGITPEVRRIHVNLTEDEAFAMERVEIAKYGRIDNGTGVLCNMTDGGEGLSGAVLSEDTRSKMSSDRAKRPPRFGYKGVWQHSNGTWMAGIRVKSKNTSLGSFPTAKDAAMAYDRAAFGQWGVNCYLNFPDLLSAPEPTRITVRGDLINRPPRSGEFKGVSKGAKASSWRAAICDNGVEVSLGSFRTAEDAALAYDCAARKLWGSSCYLNFPENANPSPPNRITRSTSQRTAAPRSGLFKGVSLHKKENLWHANIHLDGKSKHLGRFESAEAAARAYDAAALANWGEGCYLNFPKSGGLTNL